MLYTEASFIFYTFIPHNNQAQYSCSLYSGKWESTHHYFFISYLFALNTPILISMNGCQYGRIKNISLVSPSFINISLQLSATSGRSTVIPVPFVM